MFKIYGINRNRGTMVVDWLDDQISSHPIPPELMADRPLTAREIYPAVEAMRPVKKVKKKAEEDKNSLDRLEDLVEVQAPIQTASGQSEKAISIFTKKGYILVTTFVIDAGDFASVAGTTSTDAGRSHNYTYIVKGKVTMSNPNRDDITYTASDSLLGGRQTYPGMYKVIAEEDSIFRCVSFRGDFFDHEVEQIALEKDNAPVTINNGWKQGVVLRGSTFVNGADHMPGAIFNLTDGDEVQAKESSLILLVKKMEVEQ